MPEIVCIGEPLFELNQPHGEDIFRQGHGGDTSNCAIAAARQGASVAYVTAVGADQFGDSFLDLWKRENIDVTAVKRSPIAHTGLYDEWQRTAGVRLTGGRERISAVVPSKEQRALLGMKRQEAAMLVERTGCLDERPVEFRITLVRGSRFSFAAEWESGRTYQVDVAGAY